MNRVPLSRAVAGHTAAGIGMALGWAATNWPWLVLLAALAVVLS